MVAGSIITVATLKGGSGKSTVVSCLAVHWHLRGRRSAVIDADPQRSIVRIALRERSLGGVPVVENATEDACKLARSLAAEGNLVVIDTPGFHSAATVACVAVSDFLLVPAKPSPLDVDRMLDALDVLVSARGRRPIVRCLLTQSTRDSVIARHMRKELVEAGVPLLESEFVNRVAYAEAALWGATPSLLESSGVAAREIAAVAGEIDGILGIRQAA